MLRKLSALLLAGSLILPAALLAQQSSRRVATKDRLAATTAASGPQTSDPSQKPENVRPGSRAQRQSYRREVAPRHHKITKGEVAFMAGIAGTSMGIGAIAGGGVGLAIGAIVGGWGAYVGHRVWHWVK